VGFKWGKFSSSRGSDFVVPIHLRVIIWLECIVHRWEADIPDILTTVPPTWILDTVERRVIAVSRADSENNELQTYELIWFYISFCSVRERVACGASLTAGGVRGRS
jgi:hypothetical protein